MTSICLGLFIFMLVIMLLAASSAAVNRLRPHETIHSIGTEAHREAQDISDEFVLRTIQLLTQKRR